MINCSLHWWFLQHLNMTLQLETWILKWGMKKIGSQNNYSLPFPWERDLKVKYILKLWAFLQIDLSLSYTSLIWDIITSLVYYSILTTCKYCFSLVIFRVSNILMYLPTQPNEKLPKVKKIKYFCHFRQ